MGNDERDQICDTTTFNMIDTQEIRECGDIVDADTDLEDDTVYDTEEANKQINKNLNTVIAKFQQGD